MIKILKKALNLILPSYIFSIIKAVLSSFSTRKKKKRCNNKKCFIVMNGPSLLKDIDIIKKSAPEDIFVANHFADSDFYENIQPNYYILQDHYFWEEYVVDFYKKKRIKTFKNLEEKTNWPLVIFVPNMKALKYLSNNIKNSNIKFEVYNARFISNSKKNNNHLVESNKLLYFLWKLNLAAPPPTNVLVGALYVSYLEGFSSINIFGADMSFFTDLVVDQDTNDVGMMITHFYSKEFLPLYKEKTWSIKSDLAYELERLSMALTLFRTLNDFFSRSQVSIFNSSENSFIDSFERKRLNL